MTIDEALAFFKFLNGEAPFRGVWFGEHDRDLYRAHWWRKHLDDAVNALRAEHQGTVTIKPRLQTGQQEYLVPIPVDPAAPGPGRHWWPVSKGHADNVCAAAPQQAEPAVQIGWADEFGNLFPMGAWKPAKRTHHDSHKAAWRPVFLHPPAAEVQQAEPVGDFQRSAPGKIWMNLGNDGMDEIEYPTWDALVRADENITWSEDRIDATDIPYVRADLAHPPAAEVQRLRDAAKRVTAAQSGSAFAINESINALRSALEGGE